jgi:PPM family protein phosphatase
MRGKMDCFGLTDAGNVRPVNEDQFLIADLNKSMLIHQTSLSHEDHTRLFGGSQGKLLLVADGVGGEAGGQRASALAVETLARHVLNAMPWFSRLDEGHPDPDEELRSALEACQHRVEAAAVRDPGRGRMGTTLTMAYLLWPRLYVVHAGDTRCYLMRGGRLEQVTTDHTVAQKLVDQGQLAPEQAEGSRWSHVLYKCVGGGQHELDPDVYKATLQVGDSLLLCSDGLTNVVSDAQVRDVLAAEGSAAEACRRLVDLAKAGGGPDNITVVVAHFRDAEEVGSGAQERAALAEPAAAPTLRVEAPAELAGAGKAIG